jgi:hypothetical protein
MQPFAEKISITRDEHQAPPESKRRVIFVRMASEAGLLNGRDPAPQSSQNVYSWCGEVFVGIKARSCATSEVLKHLLRLPARRRICGNKVVYVLPRHDSKSNFVLNRLQPHRKRIAEICFPICDRRIIGAIVLTPHNSEKLTAG